MLRRHAPIAALAALLLRLYFVWQLPYSESGDTPVYEQLADNWVHRTIYGVTDRGILTATDQRVPGYPAFLAVVHACFGSSATAVMLVQALIDVSTCFLVAEIARRAARALRPQAQERIAVAALWLSALCPFTANYTATVLSESLAVCLTAVALLLLVDDAPRFFVAGCLAGLGTLVRPDSILVVAAAGLVLTFRWRSPSDWMRLMRAGTLLTVGVLVTLTPWAARNWLTLHKVQFLAARYGESPGEQTPRGFYAWTFTWLWRFEDVARVPWKLDVEAIRLEDVPASAFDSSAERSRVGELLARYDTTTTLTAEVDEGFAAVARERTTRNPLRTYVAIPLLRAWSLWLTPRVEILPVTGVLWPIRAQWQEDARGYCVTVTFALLGVAYAVVAALGAWRMRGLPAIAVLATFVLLRTVFFATFALAPEPRYMLECFPAALALAGGLWHPRA